MKLIVGSIKYELREGLDSYMAWYLVQDVYENCGNNIP